MELAERRLGAKALTRTSSGPERDVFIRFWEGYPDVATETSLLTAQLVQAVLQDEHREKALTEGDTDELDVMVSQEFVRLLIERVAG